MLEPALARSLSINLMAPGLRCTIVLCELFGFTSPRTFQDIVHVQIDTGENLIDLVDSVRFIAGTFVRQRLRIIFGLVFRKIVLKDFRKVLLKVFLVVIV